MTQPLAVCPQCFESASAAGPCPRCGYDHDAAAFPSALPAGTTLGKYTIGRVLGRPGGFGITYLAFDPVLRRRVAIKELMPRELVGRRSDGATLSVHTRADEGLFKSTLTSFLNEARVIAQLTHPNVVRVLDYFESNGTAYFAMEYYQGETLAERVSRSGGRLAGSEAVAFMLPVLDALHHIHSQPEPLLHRDVKPQNIYLGGGKTPILLDFGAARVSLGWQSKSLSTVLTPGFAPYEQYSTRGAQGPWSDVYGCAATLYYLVTGQAPPEAADRLSDPRIPPPNALAPGVAPALSDAIVAGLEFKPEDRPASALAFADLLTGRATPADIAATRLARPRETAAATMMAPTAAAGLGPTARPALAPTVVPDDRTVIADPPPPRRPLAVIAAAAAVVLLVLLTAAFVMFRPAPAAEPRGVLATAAPGGQIDAIGRIESPPPPAPTRTTAPSDERPPAADPRPAPPPPSSSPRPVAPAPRPAPAPAAATAPAKLPAAAPPTAVLVVVYGDDAAGSRHAETAVLRSIAGRYGLRAIDPTSLSIIRRSTDVVQAAGAGDFAAIAAAGRPYGLELIVAGSLDARALRSVGQFFTGTAELDLKMYRVSTGSVVEARTFRVGAGGAQPVLAISEAEARTRAAETAGTAAAAAMEQWLRNAFP